MNPIKWLESKTIEQEWCLCVGPRGASMPVGMRNAMADDLVRALKGDAKLCEYVLGVVLGPLNTRDALNVLDHVRLALQPGEGGSLVGRAEEVMRELFRAQCDAIEARGAVEAAKVAIAKAEERADGARYWKRCANNADAAADEAEAELAKVRAELEVTKAALVAATRDARELAGDAASNRAWSSVLNWIKAHHGHTLEWNPIKQRWVVRMMSGQASAACITDLARCLPE